MLSSTETAARKLFLRSKDRIERRKIITTCTQTTVRVSQRMHLLFLKCSVPPIYIDSEINFLLLITIYYMIA